MGVWRTNPDRANEDLVTVRDPESRARTHLANERTFPAWLRTELSLITLSLAADGLVGGILLTLAGMGKFLRGRGWIEAGTYRPDARTTIFCAVLADAFGTLAIDFVLFGA